MFVLKAFVLGIIPMVLAVGVTLLFLIPAPTSEIAESEIQEEIKGEERRNR